MRSTLLFVIDIKKQGWGAGASREKKNQESEPLGKKAGAGVANKLAGSSALLEDKKKKEIVLMYFCYSSLGKIVSFMVKKKTIILLVLYFLQF